MLLEGRGQRSLVLVSPILSVLVSSWLGSGWAGIGGFGVYVFVVLITCLFTVTCLLVVACLSVIGVSVTSDNSAIFYVDAFCVGFTLV